MKTASQSGNMFVYILGAIFLLGILLVALRSGYQPGAGIDTEKGMLQASQIQKYASELERGVTFIMQNGRSESDLRFAHVSAPGYGTPGDTPARQVFEPTGGNVEFKAPPSGANDGTMWQFYGNTHIRDLGTNSGTGIRSELLAVLPNVTAAVCNEINRAVGQTIDITLNNDPGANGCVYGGTVFTGTFVTGATSNTIDHTMFSKLPPKEACVKCQSDGNLHYYRVLLAR